MKDFYCIFAQKLSYKVIMTQVKLQSVMQAENAGLFSICFEGESFNEFEKFIQKYQEDVTLNRDLQIILTALNKMLNQNGFLERYFRPEGKMKDRVCALPIETSKLRLYCLRISDSVLIAGNGGVKNSKTYQEDSELSGYVITLQKLDELIQLALKKGEITIEEHTITDIDNKIFEL